MSERSEMIRRAEEYEAAAAVLLPMLSRSIDRNVQRTIGRQLGELRSFARMWRERAKDAPIERTTPAPTPARRRWF